ncbi:unnamed protein product [Amoebophrya sp. A25]|nr:unnamed protein product [Amoebophrya sp. A25]|eukprot:GSA25T00026024001.1
MDTGDQDMGSCPMSISSVTDSTHDTSNEHEVSQNNIHIRKPFLQPNVRTDRKDKERPIPLVWDTQGAQVSRQVLKERDFGFAVKETGVPGGLHPIQSGTNSLGSGSQGSEPSAQVHALYEGSVMNDIILSVRRPDGVSENLWLANNFVKILKETSMVSSFMMNGCCTEAACPVMRAGAHTYLWQDNFEDGTTKSGIELNAPKYIKAVLDSAQTMISDPRVFPSTPEGAFPECFRELVVPQFRRFFRCYCHFYRHHLHQMEQLGVEKRVRFCAAFCCLFCREFNMCSDTEYDTIQPLVDQWLSEAGCK